MLSTVLLSATIEDCGVHISISISVLQWFDQKWKATLLSNFHGHRWIQKNKLSNFWSVKSSKLNQHQHYILNLSKQFTATFFGLPDYTDTGNICFLKFCYFRFPLHVQFSCLFRRIEVEHAKSNEVEEWPYIFSIKTVNRYFEVTLLPYVTIIYSQHWYLFMKDARGKMEHLSFMTSSLFCNQKYISGYIVFMSVSMDLCFKFELDCLIQVFSCRNNLRVWQGQSFDNNSK